MSSAAALSAPEGSIHPVVLRRVKGLKHHPRGAHPAGMLGDTMSAAALLQPLGLDGCVVSVRISSLVIIGSPVCEAADWPGCVQGSDSFENKLVLDTRR